MATRRPRPNPLGVHLRGSGADVAVLAAHADRVELCLIDVGPDGRRTETRVPLQYREHGVWFDHVPGVVAGHRYGFRVHGRWDPDRGHRHNAAKLLLDPYARAVQPHPGLRPEHFGHVVDAGLTGDPRVRDDRDDLQWAPLGIVTAPVTAPDDRPLVPRCRTVVYEAHVRGLTRLMPQVPPEQRGTYAALGHPAVLEHLTGLGVTTLELLPVHTASDEVSLTRRGRSNYWGYTTLGYFAPDPRLAATRDPERVADEFRAAVAALHGAGVEVVLDVVYNHTCESGADGPTLSWRGLDAATYYRLDSRGADVDSTGCGNSLDARNPRVVQLVLDSLRHWCTELGVDGFRFDLAPTLARGRDGFDPDHPFLVALAADPVLADRVMIAEPWDTGAYGWRTGQFPPPFAEWNDRFRDGVREFWLEGAARAARGEAPGGVRDLATRLAGSADLFDAERGPLASVNFVTAHDGFTLADLAAYDRKHNEANGEGNADGSDGNRSYNHGVEGGAPDPAVLAARARTRRNLMATLLLATGTPMVLGGDELARSQGGNNNAYCQDGPVTWVDWESGPEARAMLAATTRLLELRRRHAVLRQRRFFAGRPVRADDTKDVAWFGPDGAEMVHERWHDPWQRVLQMFLHGVVDQLEPEAGEGPSLLAVFQGDARTLPVRLPGPPWARGYDLLWDSAADPLAEPEEAGAPVTAGSSVRVPGASVRLYRVRPAVAAP